MPKNSSLTPEQMDQMLEHAQQALQSSVEKNNSRYGSPADGDIDFKRLSQDALSRLSPETMWEKEDYAAAKDAVTQKFGVDMPMEKLAELNEERRVAQKKLEGLEKLAVGDVLATPEAVAKNAQDIAAMKETIQGLNEGIEDVQMQVNEGRAIMNAKAERNGQDKKAIVAAANADLRSGGQNEAQGESQEEEKKSVRFAFQADATRHASRGGQEIGNHRENQGASVRSSGGWNAAKPDTSLPPSTPKLR